jgi:hypothetical protein
MGALRFVGLAILTTVTPIAVLIGSSPAHAEPSPEEVGEFTYTLESDGVNVGPTADVVINLGSRVCAMAAAGQGRQPIMNTVEAAGYNEHDSSEIVRASGNYLCPEEKPALQ